MSFIFKKRPQIYSCYKALLIYLIYLLTGSIFIVAEESGEYIHYQLGIKYKNEKKYDEAIEEFRKVLAAYPDNYNAYMQMAEIRNDQNRPRLVIYNLKKALSYNPGWGKAHKMLAASYEKDGQFEKAIVELQQYQQSSDPAERDSLQNQIERLISKVSGNQNSINPIDSSKNISNNNYSYQKSSPGDYISNSKTVATSDTASIETKQRTEEIFKKAVQLYDDKKYNASLEQIRNVLNIDPAHSGGYYYAGLIRYKLGQKKMAKINFLKAFDYPELGFNAHYYLGKIFGEQKDYSKAILHLSTYISKTTYEPGKNEAIKLIEQYKKNPADSNALIPQQVQQNEKDATFSVQQPVEKEKYTQLEVQIDSMLSMLTIDTITDAGQKLLFGIREFSSGNYDKAILEFKKMLVSNPGGNAAVFCIYNTGISYLKMNLYKDAENQFQQIIDRYPNHPAAAKSHFFKALTYHERKESATAERLLRGFLQNYRTHLWAPKAFGRLGDCYVEQEQYRKAIDAYTQALQKCSSIEKVQILFKTGTAYLHLQNEKRAIESFSAAIELGEKENVYVRIPDCYYRIADIYYKAKDYQKSLASYMKVTRKYPAFQETPWGLFQIGSIYKNLKQYQEAVGIFKDLMRKYPDDYWAKQAQWKLEDSIWENEYKTVLN